MKEDPSNPAVRLSICIATLNRGAFIAETLRSITLQMDASCELVIVDGASSDNTADVIAEFQNGPARVRYFREASNSGVDIDYDKAVSYASGTYCWLMTDDDLIAPGTLNALYAAMDGNPDVIVVNSEIRTVDLSRQLNASILPVDGQAHYASAESNRALTELGAYVSFIGAVVIKRAAWQRRRREPYFGSLFIHVGVIFQSPGLSISVLRAPSIIIRYGNSMWTPRTFEIWMFKWPALVWSFAHLSATARQAVTPQAPYLSLTRLLWYRSIGVFTRTEFQRLLGVGMAWPLRLATWMIVALPLPLANVLCAAYLWMRPSKQIPTAVYDLAGAACSRWPAQALARKMRVV